MSDSRSRREALAGLARLASLALSLPAALPARAQGNTRPVHVLVGAPAGGTTDAIARAVANELARELGRPMLVENRPGAGGNIAAEFVARAAPDGSTLLLSFTSHAINASLYKKLPFDPIDDFTPITQIASVPSVLVARPGLPAGNIPELIRLARAEPGKLNFGVGSVGSSVHMAGDMFKMMTHTFIVNIPYKGTAPALADLISGHVDLMFASTISVLPHLKTGRLKALGVTSPAPLPQLPGVAPIGATVSGFRSSAWFGLFGPAGMSPALTKRYYHAVRKALGMPALRQWLESESAQPIGSTPEEFAAFLRRDVRRWAEVVRYSGATSE